MTPEELVQLADDLGLTLKQRQLADAYALSRNGTEAAKRAGHKGNDATLAATASRTLKLAKVQQYLRAMNTAALERAESGIASLAECLEYLTAVKRFHLADALNDQGEIDVKKLRSLPAGLLKKLKVRSTTDEEGQVYAQHEIEAESALAAASKLVDHYTKAGSPEAPNVTHNQVLAIFGQMPTDQLLKLREALAKKEGE